MSSESEPNASATAVGSLLAGCMLLLPFLRGNTQVLPATFEGEWLAVLLGVAAAIAHLCAKGVASSAKFPKEAGCLLAFIAFLAVQASMQPQPYIQPTLLGALYTGHAILMIWLGMSLARSMGRRQLVCIFAWFLLAGTLTNAGAGIIQFYGRPEFLEDWILPSGGGRSMGNVGQINLYANYLTVGLVALGYLWLRGGLRTAWTLAGALPLLYAAALSGTRATVVFLIWLAILGLLASRALFAKSPDQARRLKLASWGTALAALTMQMLVPALNQWIVSSTPVTGTMDRLMALGSYAEPRWQAWLTAAGIFIQHPLLGIGFGQFPLAAFQQGLDPDLSGFVWTSPHNLVLHLLAECGLPGAALALAALFIWWIGAFARFRATPDISLWFLIALVGIETLHSLLEFPLWNAQFLGATALFMGAAIPERPAGQTARSGVILLGSVITALSIGLASILFDYLRFDRARIIGTTQTLTSPTERAQATQVMHDLSNGLLGPLAESWILLGTAMDKNDLPEKLALSARVISYWPGSDMLARRAALLALAGQPQQASEVLALAARAFPHRCQVMALPLRQALEVDRAAVAPLLLQLSATTQNCR